MKYRPRLFPSLMLSSLLGVGFLCLPSSSADDSAVDLITAKGGEIELGKSVPGVIAITGDDAFALLRDANQKIVAAAGSNSEGARAVAFAHGGFLKSDNLPNQPAASVLIQNSIRWAGKSSQPKVGVHPSLTDLVNSLTAAAFSVESIAPKDLRPGQVDVFCTVAQTDLSGDEIDQLLEFSQDGGGLVVSATPWAFAKKFPDFAEFPGNRLIAPVGLRFSPDGYAATKQPLMIGGTAAPAAPKPDMKANGKPSAIDALAAVNRLAESHASLPASERDSLIAAMNSGTTLRGDALRGFLAGLKLLNEAVGPIIPTKEKPLVPGADPLIDAVVNLEDELNQSLPAGFMYAIPAANDYPGAVPADAERIIRKLTISGTWKGWLSGRGAGGWAAKEMRPTGLYAAPGEVIKVTSPGKIVGRGFEVVIGAYGGSLENRDQWHRYPRVQNRVEIDERTTEISSGLGGLITIRVPKGAEEGYLDFTVEGGVAAPLYVHGKSDINTWKDEIRKFPAPWAELASERIIIAIPSDYIRKLGDPDAVMDVWNSFIDKAAELVQVDRNDYRAERIVFDRQTAAGSMHSSYPVAAHLDRSAEQAVDARSLKSEGNWGFFHEYGHNHQHDLWSLPGTGETTCNLWSVFLFEEVIGKNRDNTHGAIRPLDRKQRMNAYFQNGRNFESEWSMWVALEPYLQVQEAFGWDPFKKVFDEYNRLPQEDWPKSQKEKNDQWVIRLSKACGKNLAPFWATWNVPLSESVFAELADLPDWEDHPVKKFATE